MLKLSSEMHESSRVALRDSSLPVGNARARPAYGPVRRVRRRTGLERDVRSRNKEEEEAHFFFWGLFANKEEKHGVIP